MAKRYLYSFPSLTKIIKKNVKNEKNYFCFFIFGWQNKFAYEEFHSVFDCTHGDTEKSNNFV
jgi:hypothetical protein